MVIFSLKTMGEKNKDSRENLRTGRYIQGIENGKNKFGFQFNVTAIVVHTTHSCDLMELPE